jgi:hypothetical protein
MGTPVSDELRALRARAYGPGADIHLDPDAQRRLAELEEEHRPPPVVDEPPTLPDAELQGPAADEEPHEESAPSPPGTDDGPLLVRLWRRRGIRRGAWIASVVVAALVGAGVAYGAALITPVPTSSGLRQIATLSPSTTAVVPVGFFGRTEGAPVFEYEGLTLFVSRLNFGEDEDVTCLDVLPTQSVPLPSEYDPDQGIQGPFYSDCSAGVFPATVVFRLDDDQAAPFDDIPEGRAVQFVLRGDRVGVYLDRG